MRYSRWFCRVGLLVSDPVEAGEVVGEHALEVDGEGVTPVRCQ